MSIGVAVVAAVSFVNFVVGQGASFLRNEVYQHHDGPLLLVRASFPLGFMCGIMGIALTAWEEDRRLRLLLIATGTLWFIAPVCLASRTACVAPIVGSALIIYNEIRRRRLHLPLIAAALALLVTAFFTFSVVNKARAMPHGLFNVPNLVQATTSDMLNSTDSILLPVKQLVASVFAGFPDVEESARYGVDSDVLLDNANPLPGTTRSPDLERYWPYEWCPLAFAGEWFGAMGWVGQILIFGAMGWMFGLTMHNLQRSRFRLISFLPLPYVTLVGLLSIEYSSRMVWRMISMSLIILIASYLVRERSRYMVRGTRDEQPRNAIGDLQESAIRALKVSTRVAMTIGQPYG
jgi:iron complex transport system permease protein